MGPAVLGMRQRWISTRDGVSCQGLGIVAGEGSTLPSGRGHEGGEGLQGWTWGSQDVTSVPQTPWPAWTPRSAAECAGLPWAAPTSPTPSWWWS